MPRADAHIHVFDPGIVQQLPESCRRVRPSEAQLYDAYTALHEIEAALVVGYQGEPWATGNNDYIAAQASAYSWLYPVAYVHDPRTLHIPALESMADRGFVGISLYLFETDETSTAGAQSAAMSDPRLRDTPVEVWQWLAQHQWLISVNSQGPLWRNWLPILAQEPHLRLLVSHLGLPPRCAEEPADQVAADALASVLALAPPRSGARQVHIKLSGFYALSEPGYDYPHRAAWPYVKILLEAFGANRLLWGSDFTPALDWVSFPQAVHVLDEMPYFSPAQRQAVQYENLMGLLRPFKTTTGERA